MKRVVAFIVFIVGVFQSFGQQEAAFSHYSFNTLGVNSAYAGSRNALTVTGLHRSQWVSFPGAPQTQTITLHTPLFKDNLGFGLSMLNDKIGPTQTSGIFIDVAYRMRLGYKGKLSFGLKGGVNLRKVDLTEITTIQEDDPNFLSGISSQALPNFGFGMYYQLPKFYLGLSTPKLLQNTFLTDPENISPELGKENIHGYLIVGGVVDVSKANGIQLKPSALVKYTSGAPIQVDLTTLFYYNEFLWAGPMFRTGDAIGVLAGVNISEQFALGYAFDWSYANTTGRYNNGSHELMLRYDFIFSRQSKIESPRHF